MGAQNVSTQDSCGRLETHKVSCFHQARREEKRVLLEEGTCFWQNVYFWSRSWTWLSMDGVSSVGGKREGSKGKEGMGHEDPCKTW